MLIARGVRHGDGGRVGVGVLEGEAAHASDWAVLGEEVIRVVARVCGFVQALCCFRIAAISYGVYARGLAGNAGSTKVDEPHCHHILRHMSPSVSTYHTHFTQMNFVILLRFSLHTGTRVGCDCQQFGGYRTANAGAATARKAVMTN